MRCPADHRLINSIAPTTILPEKAWQMGNDEKQIDATHPAEGTFLQETEPSSESLSLLYEGTYETKPG